MSVSLYRKYRLQRFIEVIGQDAAVAVAVRRMGLRGAYFLLIGAAFVAFAVYLGWGETLDDAAISFAYAKNLVGGQGLVVSPGAEPVEAYSNFLWVLLIAPLVAMRLDVILAAKVVGIVLSLATLVLLARMPGLLTRRGLGWLDLLAPTLTALAAPFALWSVSGMENALESLLLVTALVLSMWEINHPRAVPWSSAAFVALALTRPEGLVFWLAACAHRLLLFALGRRPSRNDLMWLAGFLVPMALYHVWHYQYFGELVPNTYFAKASHRSIREVFHYATTPSDPGFGYIRSFVSDYRLLPLFVFLPLSLLGPRGLTHYSLPVMMLLAGTAAVLYDGGENAPHYRFLSPLIPLFYLSVQEGSRTVWSTLARLMPRFRIAPARAVAGLAVTGAVLAAALPTSLERAGAVHASPFAANYSTVEQRARQLEQLAGCLGREHASVLTPDIGAVAFRTSLLVIDVAGLADSYIARHQAGPDLFEYVFANRRPDIIAIHEFWLIKTALWSEPRLWSDYVPSTMERDASGRLLEGILVRRDLALVRPDCLG